MSPRPGRPELAIACPSCNARPTMRCHTATGNVAQTHVARLVAALPVRTPAEQAQRDHEQRQFDAQYSKLTLVTVAAGYTCGCKEPASEPIPLSEANTWPGRTVICDEHDEYAVVNEVDVRLVADERTLWRILDSAGVDNGSARYVAADQNDDSRANRIRLGMDGGPT